MRVKHRLTCRTKTWQKGSKDVEFGLWLIVQWLARKDWNFLMALHYRWRHLIGAISPLDSCHCTSSDTFVAERGHTVPGSLAGPIVGRKATRGLIAPVSRR